MLSVLVPTTGLLYDVLAPHKVPGGACANKPCVPWSLLNATVDSYWQAGAPIAGAASLCAQLGNAPGLQQGAIDPTGLGAEGAFCYCDGGKSVGMCESTLSGIPEQINVQIAGPNVVVLSFVTFEGTAPTRPPQAKVGSTASTTALLPDGPGSVTHTYVSPSGKRIYYMHFVTLRKLEPRGRYYYSVRSGGNGAAWSAIFSFRAPYADGITRIGIFGDMGLYAWNNMANLQSDAKAGEIDVVVHIGDHCYNLGGDDERRGDAYMDAYQPVLTSTPWLPVVGNHEFYDGDALRRYLNQSDGTVVASPAADPLVAGAASTASAPLARLLATGNHHGAGTHGGSVPSGTSRWFAVDVGLVHLVALDLNMYNGVDACGAPCRAAQLAWLEKDLQAANANRANVPWIVAFSHFPLYCSNCPKPGHEPQRDGISSAASTSAATAGTQTMVPPRGQVPPPGAWWQSELCEFGAAGHDRNCIAWDTSQGAEGTAGRRSDSPGNDDQVPDLEPLFMRYGVDVYASGHIHDFEWIYPTYNATPVQKDFTDPRAPVHLVTGNGGPPSPSRFGTIEEYSYRHSSTYSYTRLVVHNATTMEWVQVANDADTTELERLVITQSRHGAFPEPPTRPRTQPLAILA